MIDPILRSHAPQADDRAEVEGVWKDEAKGAARAEPDIGSLRADLERLRQRESQIMSLIDCQNPDKLLHDLRNILNELQLLRMLVETDKL